MSPPFDLARMRAALARRTPNALEASRRASVALVLTGEDGAPELLLVRRAERAGDPWSGHMALPGGHAQLEDSDLAATARRETLEETGIDLRDAELLGQLDDISPMRRSDIAVTPFVFWLEARPLPRLSEELVEALWVPLSEFAQDALRTTHRVAVGETTWAVPAVSIGERVVWGMTFRLLTAFLADLSAEGPDGPGGGLPNP